MIKEIKVITGLIISVLSAITSYGQDDSTFYRLKALNNPVLEGDINVFYSSGYKERAEEVRSYVLDATKFYKKKLEVSTEFSVAVLTRSDWERIARIPFDIPFGSDAPHVVFLPANLGEGVVSSGAGRTRHLASAETLRKLESAGYTFEEAGLKNIDFIGLHELGHLIAETLGISFYPGKPNKWYNEFIASYLAYAYLKEKDPVFASTVEILTEHNIGTMPAQRYTSLEDFERLYVGVGPENYGWFQNKFTQLVVSIYEKKGLDFIGELKNSSFPKNEVAPIQSLIDDLEKIVPGFKDWSRGF